MRAFLVSDTGDPYEDTWQIPVKAFTSKEAALDFARERQERGEARHYAFGKGCCVIDEIEVEMGR